MKEDSDRVFLITGAKGNTGHPAARLLLERGHRVRAFVHREDDRSRQLAAAGAEVVVGDLLNFHDVSAAVPGVSGAYFCYPIAPGLLDATVIFAQAATEAGLRSVVSMSQISARREAASNAARQHWLAERLLDRTAMLTAHLRPTSPSGSAGGGAARATGACSVSRSETAVTPPSPELIRGT